MEPVLQWSEGGGRSVSWGSCLFPPARPSPTPPVCLCIWALVLLWVWSHGQNREREPGPQATVAASTQVSSDNPVALFLAGHGLPPRQGNPAQGPQVQERLLRQWQSGDHRLWALQHFRGAAGWQVRSGGRAQRGS